MFVSLYAKTPRRIPVSSWTPLTLNPVAWYIASPTYCFSNAGGTVPCNVGDNVYIWKDHSGNSKDLTQATASNQPTLQQLVNGDYVVRFDGVDDRMTHTNLAFAGDMLFGWIGNRSAIGRMIWANDDSHLLVDYYPVDNKVYHQIGATSAYASTAFAGQATRHYATFYRSGTNLGFRANGSAYGTISNSSGTLNLSTLGGAPSFYFGGDVSEMIAVNSYVDPTTNLEAYLASRMFP